MGTRAFTTNRNYRQAIFAIALANILTLSTTTSGIAESVATKHQDCMALDNLLERHRCHRSASNRDNPNQVRWGRWQIDQDVSAFDDLPIVTARLQSNERRENLLGNRRHAHLVARCGEGSMMVAIHSYGALWAYGLPDQPNALIRFDEQPSEQHSLTRDTSGETIGHFETLAATELLSRIALHNRLTVRLARGTQAPTEYTFDLRGAENLPELLAQHCAAGVD